MVRRVVAPVAVLRERVGLVGVDGLVVVERPVAEAPEARGGGEQQDGDDAAGSAPGGRGRGALRGPPASPASFTVSSCLGRAGILRDGALPELTT